MPNDNGENNAQIMYLPTVRQIFYFYFQNMQFAIVNTIERNKLKYNNQLILAKKKSATDAALFHRC